MKFEKVAALLAICGVAADVFIYYYEFSRAVTDYLSYVVDRLDYETGRLSR